MLASTCQNMALTLSGFRIRIGKIYLLLFLFASPFPEFESQTIKLIGFFKDYIRRSIFNCRVFELQSSCRMKLLLIIKRLKWDLGTL